MFQHQVSMATPKIGLAILPLLTLLSCSSASNVEAGASSHDLPLPDTLFRIQQEATYDYGVPCGYVNQRGDTIVPMGKYVVCMTDTAVHFATVIDQTGSGPKAIGLDQQGHRLFEIFWYDNGPDYVSEGLFRILEDGKIGYADESGRVVIDPQFACASPFSDGQAKVTFDCELGGDPSDEHRPMVSDNWFIIDRKGEKME